MGGLGLALAGWSGLAAGPHSVTPVAPLGVRFGPAPGGASAPAPAGPRVALMGGDPPVGLVVDTSSREQVRQFYQGVYAASLEADPGWDGDPGACVAGTTTTGFQGLVALRVNYYRAMAGLPAGITMSETLHPRAMAAALIMTANNWLDHFPPEEGTVCWSEAGYDGASTSNLALGVMGPDAIDGYMLDYGGPNFDVPHRRWLLYPQTRVMATGDIPDTEAGWAANSTIIFDDHYWDVRPATRDGYVAWPAPGYVPYPVVPVRWSFALPGADFSAATVTVLRDGFPLDVTLEPTPEFQAGEAGITWRETALDGDFPYDWPAPVADTTYQVWVEGVTVDGEEQSFGYDVIVMDPRQPGPDSVLIELAGPDEPLNGVHTPYTFPPVPNATAYEWMSGRPSMVAGIEGADVDLGPFVARTSPGYEVRDQKPKFVGQKCYHLAQPLIEGSYGPADQMLTYDGPLLPGGGAKVSFESRLSWATGAQIGRVEVSIDGGASWDAIYTQPGDSDEPAGDYWFNPVEVSLAAYANRLILLRFNYHYAGGPFYPYDEAEFDTPEKKLNNGHGWYIEDVEFTNVQVLSDLREGSSATPGTILFASSGKGLFALVARGLLWGEFPLEWGLVRTVNVTQDAPVSIAEVSLPVIEAGSFHLEVRLNRAAPGATLSLRYSPVIDGTWMPVAGTAVVELEPGLRYRLSAPLGGNHGFFQPGVQP